MTEPDPLPRQSPVPPVPRAPLRPAVPVPTWRRLPLWVIVVIGLCCMIEAAFQIAALAGQPAARQAGQIVAGFWSPVLWHGYGIYPGQPAVMFLTYGLLHGGLLHLAMNMVSLAVVARELGPLIGAWRMALVYLLGQIAAAALFGLMAPDAGPMVGASGAIFALAAALIGYAAVVGHSRRRPMGRMWRSVATIVGLNVALTLAVPDIAWQAHLGGALVGAVMGIAMGFGVARREGWR